MLRVIFLSIITYVNANSNDDFSDTFVNILKPLDIITNRASGRSGISVNEGYLESFFRTLLHTARDINRRDFIEALKGTVSASESIANTADRIVRAWNQKKFKRQLKDGSLESILEETKLSQFRPLQQLSNLRSLVPSSLDNPLFEIPPLKKVIGNVANFSVKSIFFKNLVDDLFNFPSESNDTVSHDSLPRKLRDSDYIKPLPEYSKIPGLSSQSLAALKLLDPIGIFSLFGTQLFSETGKQPIEFDTFYSKESQEEVEKLKPAFADLSVMLERFIAETESFVFFLSDGITNPFVASFQDLSNQVQLLLESPEKYESWFEFKNRLIDFKQFLKRLPLAWLIPPQINENVTKSIDVIDELIVDVESTLFQVTGEAVTRISENMVSLGQLLKVFDQQTLIPKLKINGIDIAERLMLQVNDLPKIILTPVLPSITNGFGFFGILEKVQNSLPFVAQKTEDTDPSPKLAPINSFFELSRRVLAPAIYEQTESFLDYLGSLESNFMKIFPSLLREANQNASSGVISTDFALIKSLQLSSLTDLARLLNSASVSLLDGAITGSNYSGSKINDQNVIKSFSGINDFMKVLLTPQILFPTLTNHVPHGESGKSEAELRENVISNNLFNIGRFISSAGNVINTLDIDCVVSHVNADKGNISNVGLIRSLALLGRPLALLKQQEAGDTVINQVLNARDTSGDTQLTRPDSRCDELQVLLSVLQNWASLTIEFGEKLAETAAYKSPEDIRTGIDQLLNIVSS